MISIVRYSSDKIELWNQFNRQSKNYLFMIDRNYMDYHSDRFKDHSLMFYDDGELIAILPISEEKKCFISHGGLTYGGFVVNNKLKQHNMNECFDALIDYASENGIEEIYYKTIPHIYHSQPAEEDKYSLFINKAIPFKIEASTVINLKNPLKMPKGRKAQINRAKREGTIIEERSSLQDFCKFINLENDILRSRHNTTAVHTAEELKMLHDKFPQNIHLYVAIYGSEIIAGTVVYEYIDVIHTQYMAANDIARKIGALDLTIAYVIDKYEEEKKWLDFGISTENGGKYLNQGLISQKEGFGGRTCVYETWKVDVKNT